jgi:hypothetical protein
MSTRSAFQAAAPMTVRRIHMQFIPPKQRFVAKCLNFSAVTFTIATFCLQGYVDCLGIRVHLGQPLVL